MRKNTVRLQRMKLSFNFIELGAIPTSFDQLLLKYFSFLTCVFLFRHQYLRKFTNNCVQNWQYYNTRILIGFFKL